MARNRRVFISDIHMGTAESIEGDHPYGWLRKDRADMLAEFLNELAVDDSLSELVIGGDLFDEWVEPYTVSPTDFKTIAGAPQNRPVISALNNLTDVDGVTVTYVPGNHDMLLSSGALAEILPKVKPVISREGLGIQRVGNTAVEHGSLYTLFNAPDSYDNPGHILPLGFFVGRTMAEGVTTGRPITNAQYKEILIHTLEKLLRGESLSSAVFESIVKEIESPTDSVLMNGMDSYEGEITVDEVSKTYKDLYDDWDEKMPGNVPATIAVIGEAATLYPAALKEYALPFHKDNKKPNIVLFGHTHVWEINGIKLSLGLLLAELARIVGELVKGDIKKAISIVEDLEDPGPDKESDFIYVNTGTWISGDGGVAGDPPPPATYAVVEEEVGRTSVKVYEYKGSGTYLSNKPLGSRFTSN